MSRQSQSTVSVGSPSRQFQSGLSPQVRGVGWRTIQVELVYYITHPGGREERLVHGLKTRYLFRFEAEHILARCGFEVEHLYAGFDKSPYGSKYPGELLFVARKV